MRRSRHVLVAGTLMWGLVLSGCAGGEPEAHPFDATREPDVPATNPPETSDGTDEGPTDEPANLVLRISDPRIQESSGLARSHVHRGVVYTHNDRGGNPEVFAVDSSGTRAVLTLKTAAVDWEDIASTPDGRIWVADIGDNDVARRTVSVSVFREPEVLTSSTLPVTTYEFVYPDGPRDAEALLVQPGTGRIHLVTKEEQGGIYVAPERLSTRAPNALTWVADAPRLVTGGDFAPDGEQVVLRNHRRAFFQDGVDGDRREVQLPRQQQGESITFSADGGEVWVGSEGADSEVLRVATPR